MSDSNVPGPEVGASADASTFASTIASAGGRPGDTDCPGDADCPGAAVADVVARAKRGDGHAKRWLFEEFREVAYRVAMRITGKEADAMDVVQDAYIKAFESLHSLADEGRFKTWMLRIVNNKALDLLRSRKVRKAVSLESDDEQHWGGQIPSDAEDNPSAAMSQRETRAQIAEALDSLPPDQRVVLSLFAAGSMTYGEIAEVAGVPLGTVMSRLYRARRRMKELLGDLDAGLVAGKAGAQHADPPPIELHGIKKRKNS